MTSHPQLTRWVPLAFVLLWSTGFIGAGYALPFIEPFNLLFIRMLITVLLFLGLALVLRSRWPTPRQALHQMVTGSLVHAMYLGGVFSAIKWDLPAGVTSIYVGLQPVVTTVLAWMLLNERLRTRQWLGLVLGLGGVALVLSRFAGGPDTVGHMVQGPALIAGGLALLGISVGTLYQKRFGGGVNLVTGSLFQYLVTALWMGILTFSFETGEVTWDPQLILALAWLVIVLSVMAILLLMFMIREGEASRVASYFYLVPPITAVEGWLLFDETLAPLGLVGMALAVAGVYLVIRKPTARGSKGVGA
ncbi:MAG: DMT family transporter [Gammaproteobacteria bacterium]